MTPLDKVEVLYEDLVRSYGEGSDREIRAASKLLMVALVKLEQHAGANWYDLVQEYVDILKNDRQKFLNFVQVNRSKVEEDDLTIRVRR